MVRVTWAVAMLLLAVGFAQARENLILGEAMRSTLDLTNAVDEAGRFHEGWSIDLRVDQTVVIDATARDLDPVLRVRLPGGEWLEDDDGGQRLNARLTVRAPEAGEAVIVVTGYAPGMTGDYTLRVSEVEPTLIALGDFGGSIADGPAVLSLPVAAGMTLAMDVSAEGFDPMLSLTGPGGETLFSDDTGESLAPHLDHTPQVAGETLLTISAFHSPAVVEGIDAHAFTLTVEPASP
jgi:hypothetical protein